MGIDEKRTVSDLPVKPRKFKGTPAQLHRHRWSLVALAFFSALGFAYTQLDSTKLMKENLVTNFSQPSENRRSIANMPVVGPLTHENIRELLKQRGIEFEDVPIKNIEKK